MSPQIIPRNHVEIKLFSFIRVVRGLKVFRKLLPDFSLFNSCAEAIFYYVSRYVEPDMVVGVPLYGCSSIANAVHQAGRDVRYLDISIGNCGYIVPDDISQQVDVLLFIHFFGFKFSNFESIKSECSKLIILEDCSHLRPTYRGCGDRMFFSFNFHKPIAAGVGGAVYPKLESPVPYRPEDKMSSFITFASIVFKNFSYIPFIYALISDIFRRNKRQYAASGSSAIYPLGVNKLSTIFEHIIGNQLVKWCEANKVGYLQIPTCYRLPVDVYNVSDLCYFPIFFPTKNQKDKFESRFKKLLDLYMLWENCFSNAKELCLEVSPDSYPATRDLMETTIFLPDSLFMVSSNKYGKALNEVIEYLIELSLIECA